MVGAVAVAGAVVGSRGVGGSGRVGASTEGAATAPAPGVTTMGLGQSALVMGAEGISSSEISMSSPEDCWPCRESQETVLRLSLGEQAGSQSPSKHQKVRESPLKTQKHCRSCGSDPGPLPSGPCRLGESLNLAKPVFLFA